uniref:AMP-dependent synthetase/ligase domain-containing protein n=1 Tax=Clastoptera arizonana TaxID=38151 RepID=A0A1B6C5J6_9HEMI
MALNSEDKLRSCVSKNDIRSVSMHVYNGLKQQQSTDLSQIEADTGRTLTYSEVLNKCACLVPGLVSLGVNRNSKIMIFSYNSQEAHLLILSCIFIGATIVPTDISYQDDEILYLLNLIEPDIIFSEKGSIFENLQNLLPLTTFLKPRLIKNDIESPDLKFVDLLFEADPDFTPPHKISEDDHVFAIMFSSGTTGRPKSIMLPDSYFLNEREGRATGQRTLILSSVSWGSGLYSLTSSINRGYTMLYFQERKGEVYLLETVQKYKVKAIVGNPSFFLRMAFHPRLSEYDTSSLIFLYSLGAGLRKENQQLISTKLLNGCNTLLQVYGATEMGVGVASSLSENRMGSCGRVVKGVDFKVIDPQTGNVVGANVEGELYFRRSNLMLGYFKDPISTAAAIDKDGWYRTGDIGHFDNDGFVYILDRMKEIINYKNHKISPSDIEYSLLKHPKIEGVLAVGVPHPKDGEWPAVIVVCKEDISRKEIIDYIAANMSEEFVPRGGIEFSDSIPEVNGKIRRCIKEKYLPIFLKDLKNKD